MDSDANVVKRFQASEPDEAAHLALSGGPEIAVPGRDASSDTPRGAPTSVWPGILGQIGSGPERLTESMKRVLQKQVACWSGG
jgi:hypothetical protein